MKFEKTLAINQIKLDAYKEINNLYLKISCDAIENKDFGKEHFMKYKIEFHTIVSTYIDLFTTFNALERINIIGNTIFELSKWRERQQVTTSQDHDIQINLNKSFIEAYTGLLNDLRQELFNIA